MTTTTLTFTVSADMTATEFKNKHGGWPLGVRCGSSAPLSSLTGQFTRGIQKIYPAISITAIYHTDTMAFFVMYGASSLEYEQFTKRTGEALLTFPNGYKIFNFVKPHDYILTKMDVKMSPPAYTEKPQQEQPQQEQPQQEQVKDAVASAWKEIEEARKQIEEERKQIEEEKIKMKLRAKMSLFDEEVAKFKQQFFTQEELVSIRKTFDPLY
jgi:hypothetical protein